MVIKSKVLTFGFWLSTITVVGGILALVYPLIYGMGNALPVAYVLFYALLILVILMYGKLLYDSNIIHLDTDYKTITLINRFTRKIVTYNLDYFDGKATCFQRLNGTTRNLYLLKDKVAIIKISEFIYSNQKELEEALGDIPALGTFKYSFTNQWKLLFRRPIVK